jgi:beta-lactamase regulating signal transducer with metallopeptidase domain
MLHYIIQTIAFQLFFLLAYDLFLKKETFFNWNRIYLLATIVLSMLLPYIKINRFKEVVPQEYIIRLPEVILGGGITNSNNVMLENSEVVEQSTILIFQMILYIGVAVALALFLYKLIRIVFFISKSTKHKNDNITVINLKNSNAAFSFFNIVFLGENLKTDEKEAILKHEIIHVKQKHTLDLLFLEVLSIIFWFNPLVYMYQNRIEVLHEYIADAKAVKHQSKIHYYQNLLAQVFDTQNISFINPFFKQSLIKKRIVMLTKSKSKQIKLIKYAVLIPMVLGMLVYTSCEKQNEMSQEDELNLNQYSYTLDISGEMSDEVKIIHNKYEAFLKSNTEYVSWAKLNIKNRKISYSVHSINEKLSEGFEPEPLEVNSKDGKFYKMFVHFTRELETEESKRQKEKELLEQKEKYKTALEVPFIVIDQVPVFPGCEGLSNEEQRKCMSQNISKHVNRNFNTKLAEELNLTGRQRINVIFKIDTEGNIVDVKSRAPHSDLEAEAIRVIKTLPHFKSGINNGKKVTVSYSLPIIFQVSE